MSLRFAMVTDTHVGLAPIIPATPTAPTAPAASAARLSRVYEAIAGLAPDFVLHCGDITDTGLPGEYDLYQQAIPAALRGRIRHVPGNHDVRWDPTAKGLYRAHFGGTPYSFGAGGVHFAGFDPTQPLLEPGHCGAAGLQWLARDLGRLAAGTPALLFQHFPVGGEHDYVDDQAALLELIAGYDVRGILAGHVHRETVTRLDGLTQVTLKAVRNDPVFYWADLAGDGSPALTVSRVTVAEDRTQASSPVAAVPLSDHRPARRHRILAGADAPGFRLPVQAGTAELPRPQWRLRLTGSVQGGIAVAGTVIVATSTGGDVAAFRAAASPGDRRVSWLWRARRPPGRCDGRSPAVPCTRPPCSWATAPRCSRPSRASSHGSASPAAASCGRPASGWACRTRAWSSPGIAPGWCPRTAC